MEEVVLYISTLCPFSRMAGLLLGEVQPSFSLSRHKPWETDKNLLRLNPNLSFPVVAFKQPVRYLIGFYPLVEAMGADLMQGSEADKAEIRRLIAWFNGPLWQEVTHPFLFEKKGKIFLKKEEGGGPPDLRVLRTALHRLDDHLDYLSYLAETRDWLVSERMTGADIAAAAQISCIDYLTLIPWDRFPFAKAWYARIKSRPSFQFILKERLAQIPPTKIYDDLDF